MPRPSLDEMLQAPEPHVRAVLRALCQDHRNRFKALTYLGDLQAVDKSTDLRKRKAHSELAICVQCDEAFDKNDADVKSAQCLYHWGKLEADYAGDFWADHDEDCHGVIDTVEMREQYPEGFTWTCCEKPGDEKGCKTGRHEADPVKSRKGSGDPGDIDSEADEDESGDE